MESACEFAVKNGEESTYNCKQIEKRVGAFNLVGSRVKKNCKHDYTRKAEQQG